MNDAGRQPALGAARRFGRTLAFAALALLAHNAFARTGEDKIESGTFVLHKFEQAIGKETYDIVRDGDSCVVHTSFEFSDRGTRVPLTATLRAKSDLTPEHFEIKGGVSRFSSVDTAIDVGEKTAQVREEKTTRETPLPERFFTLQGYAPIAMQMLFVRYRAQHAITGPLAILPHGNVTVEPRGHEKMKLGEREIELDRFSVVGLVWGRETLWFDAELHLVAAVTCDAEFDHFEAVREDCEPLLATFVHEAAADGMALQAELAERMSPQRKGALVIRGARLIDGTDKPPLEDATIVIEGDRIRAIGRGADIHVPEEAQVIDARGKSVLSGLWDMHAHFEQAEWGPVYLAAGVTSARDVGNEFEFITSVRDAIDAGRGLGPRLLLAGIVDGDGPMALGLARANTPEEARTTVERYHAAGFQQIKIYSSVRPEIVPAICEAAHSAGMTVTGHVPVGMDALEAVAAGFDQINHIQYLLPVMKDKNAKPVLGGLLPAPLDLESSQAKHALAVLREHHTVIDPTIALFEILMNPSDTPVESFEPGAAKVPLELAGLTSNSGVPAIAAAKARAKFQQYLDTIGALHAAGITIVAGTDQAVPGHSLHREIELYVKAGFTPLEALQSATIVPARVMGRDKDLGTLEVGKLADLILVAGDPLRSIGDIRKIDTVVRGGRAYDCATLWRSVGFKP